MQDKGTNAGQEKMDKVKRRNMRWNVMERNMGKRNKRRCMGRFCVCLTGLLFLFSLEGLAAEPGQQETELSDVMAYTAVDGHEISEERLTDSVIEYEELGSLIHAGNPTIQEIVMKAEDTRAEYQEMRDYLRSERDGAREDKEEAEDEGDMEQYAESASLEAIYKSGVRNYNDVIKRLDQYGANRDRIILERQLTNAAQGLMISWQFLSLQQEYLEKVEELLYAQYENSQIQMQAGMAAGNDVQAAYHRWMAANNSLASAKDGRDTVYQNLCLLLGAENDGSVVLGAVPSVNLYKIEEMNLKEDIQKAINNNVDIINERHTSAKGTDALDNKARKIGEMEENVKVQMKQLYETVFSLKTAYDAAFAGLAGAEIVWSNCQTQYAMGMLSRAEFLQQETAYIEKKVAFASADLGLFQALQIYDWAVKGIMDEM